MILLAQSNLSMLFVLAGLGVIIAILLRRSYGYLSRQRRDDNALVVLPRPKPEPVTRLMDGPPKLSRWEVEMHQTARDLSAEINTRASLLQAMIAEADRAATRLENALRKTSESQSSEHNSWKDAPDAENSVECSTSTVQSIHVLADYGFSNEDIAARLDQSLAEIKRIRSQPR